MPIIFDIVEENKDSTIENKYNLVGFFELLSKVDKRINPELYKLIQKNND